MIPLVPSKELETTTVTPDEIVYTPTRPCVRPRRADLDRRGLSNLRGQPHHLLPLDGQSRALWTGVAHAQGPALAGDAQRTPPETVEIVLAESIARPTLGARRLLEHLAERDVSLSASGVQKVLVRRHLGRRAQRVAALAQITAAGSGLVTETAKEGPFGARIDPRARADGAP